MKRMNKFIKKAIKKQNNYNKLMYIVFVIIVMIVIGIVTYKTYDNSNVNKEHTVSTVATKETITVKQSLDVNKANKAEKPVEVHTVNKMRKASIEEYEMYETSTATQKAKQTSTVANKDDTTEKTNTTTHNTTNTQNNNTYFNVPQGNTSFFAYMDYSTITDTNSYQYKYQVNYCYTDEMGLRRNQYGDYVIALGSYYGTEIGTRYSITLDNGTTFTAVLGDCKADVHTDINNQYRSAGFSGEYQNVIEFIVDNNYLSNEVKSMGNIGAYDMFNCNSIISISKI